MWLLVHFLFGFAACVSEDIGQVKHLGIAVDLDDCFKASHVCDEFYHLLTDVPSHYYFEDPIELKLMYKVLEDSSKREKNSFYEVCVSDSVTVHKKIDYFNENDCCYHCCSGYNSTQSDQAQFGIRKELVSSLSSIAESLHLSTIFHHKSTEVKREKMEQTLAHDVNNFDVVYNANEKAITSEGDERIMGNKDRFPHCFVVCDPKGPDHLSEVEDVDTEHTTEYQNEHIFELKKLQEHSSKMVEISSTENGTVYSIRVDNDVFPKPGDYSISALDHDLRELLSSETLLLNSKQLDFKIVWLLGLATLQFIFNR